MTDPRPYAVSVLVLAAGRSRRMGDANKLLLAVGGRPMVRRSVMPYLEADLDEVVVVTGHDAEAVREALAGLPVRFAHNPQFEEGMASSLRTGVRALSGATHAMMVGLGDMPGLQSTTVDHLMQTFRSSPPPAIVLPTVNGRRGHPVVFDAAYREELAGLQGDVGARSVLRAHAEAVVDVPVDDPGILIDLDTPDAYRSWTDGPGRV